MQGCCRRRSSQAENRSAAVVQRIFWITRPTWPLDEARVKPSMSLSAMQCGECYSGAERTALANVRSSRHEKRGCYSGCAAYEGAPQQGPSSSQTGQSPIPANHKRGQIAADRLLELHIQDMQILLRLFLMPGPSLPVHTSRGLSEPTSSLQCNDSACSGIWQEPCFSCDDHVEGSTYRSGLLFQDSQVHHCTSAPFGTRRGPRS